jgi:four helix bundle protein
MRTRQFRDLLVWRRSMRLVEAVYEATRSFPKEEMFGLAGQMRRSAVSVPSNIAEGLGRDSEKSFAQFLNQAKGSLYELETQLELACNLDLMPQETNARLQDAAAEIARMLHGLRSTLRNSRATTPAPGNGKRPAESSPMASKVVRQRPVPEVRVKSREETTADSSLTTPKLNNVWGPVR